MNDDPRQPVGQGDLVVEEMVLSDFTRVLDALMIKLGASDAAASELRGLDVTTTQAGGSIAEVSGLTSRYSTVLDRLRTLARVQRQAVDALGIATLISERGYEAVEEEQVARLRSLMSGWEDIYAAQPDFSETTGDGTVGGGGGAPQTAL
ncbi:hypothetical protein [Streptomyces sp. 6N223]|uniref:hypothetical protein n=1 Tax=Streptomyces sp. 6N223 TaxID=3457412 RepID=UPI003FCF1EC0